MCIYKYNFIPFYGTKAANPETRVFDSVVINIKCSTGYTYITTISRASDTASESEISFQFYLQIKFNLDKEQACISYSFVINS